MQRIGHNTFSVLSGWCGRRLHQSIPAGVSRGELGQQLRRSMPRKRRSCLINLSCPLAMHRLQPSKCFFKGLGAVRTNPPQTDQSGESFFLTSPRCMRQFFLWAYTRRKQVGLGSLRNSACAEKHMIRLVEIAIRRFAASLPPKRIEAKSC